MPTLWLGAFRLLRLICIRERISLVHCHQAFSTLGGEALVQARTMGYKVRLEAGWLSLLSALQHGVQCVQAQGIWRLPVCFAEAARTATTKRTLPPALCFALLCCIDVSLACACPGCPSTAAAALMPWSVRCGAGGVHRPLPVWLC